jgi:anthranilate synthase component I
MKRITLKPKITRISADTYTPVGIYLKLRDAFPQSLLLECSDYSSRQDAYSYICIKPIAGIKVNSKVAEIYYPDESMAHKSLNQIDSIVTYVDEFFKSFETEGNLNKIENSGFYGFTSYDAVNLFDNVEINISESEVPLIRYDFYQVVISINHFNNTLSLCEFLYDDSTEISEKVISLLANRNISTYPFSKKGEETSNITDSRYMEMVNEGKRHCARGDVFQIVLSRQFNCEFSGDEFNVYRALRSINPSPYLFYFDYLGYKLFGSSPEAQLKVENGIAKINPIAGTTQRKGNAQEDKIAIDELLIDPKENSEHAMLVDLARNDLSKYSSNVVVENFKEVHTYSHLIHLVSNVTGKLDEGIGVYKLFAATFPAGTLTGAPKHRAIQLINNIESTPRGFYGGAIGFIGLNESLNHAIMIRSFLSINGNLVYQAGAGIVIRSTDKGELKEVNTKISALRSAIELANNTNN